MKSLFFQTAARILQPLLLLFSVFLLLRGHNEPGGGFTGGLMAAASFVLYGLAYDIRSARAALRCEPHALVGAGLLVAAGSGVASLLIGEPFMTTLWKTVDLGMFGSVDISTPLFFDLGVYLVVLGVVLLIMFAMLEEVNPQ